MIRRLRHGNSKGDEVFGSVKLDTLAMESLGKHELTRFYDKLKQEIVSRMISIRIYRGSWEKVQREVEVRSIQFKEGVRHYLRTKYQ